MQLLLAFLWPAIIYVYGANYFWQSMAYTTISGLFIGATFYRDHLNQVYRATVAIGFYATAIALTSLNRVSELSGVEITPMAFASHATIIFVTGFYLFGLIIGAMITSSIIKKRPKSKRVSIDI